MWDDVGREGTGRGSTGCSGVVPDVKAIGVGGILWTLVSHSGSDSVSLREVSGSAGAMGQAGITDYSQNLQTTTFSDKGTKRSAVPSPILDPNIRLRFTLSGF